MPVEFELEAYADRELVMPRFTGSLARGILLQLIGRMEPRSSQEPNIRKTYSGFS